MPAASLPVPTSGRIWPLILLIAGGCASPVPSVGSRWGNSVAPVIVRGQDPDPQPETPVANDKPAVEAPPSSPSASANPSASPSFWNAPTLAAALQYGQGSGRSDSNLPSDSIQFPPAFPEPGPGMGPFRGSDLPFSSRFAPAFPESRPGATAPENPTWYSVHAQGTVITQKNNVFRSPYSGPNSFLPGGPQATSETATVFLAARLWKGTEIVFTPEVGGGAGLSNVFGIAGFPNYEMTKVGSVEPTPYISRLYVRQTWGLGGEQEDIPEGPNVVADKVDVNRIVLVVGRFAAPDFFDDNRYSDDPRSQFMNWAIALNGAWDYAADTRGYIYGGGLTYNTKNWAIRYGLMAVAASANGYNLDPNILLANSHNVELQLSTTLNNRPGHVHILGYANNAHMGSYALALAQMPVNPDIIATRAYRTKFGFGLSVDQELADDFGIFSRLGWNDGRTESWMFTEIDRTASLGLSLRGDRWGRKQDEFGLAGVINGISGVHAAYLAAGGLGFQLGDGRLNYGYEEILETYYRFQPRPGIQFSIDFQGINNPGYNRDRGPVFVASGRMHFEF